jgi:tRNA(fMet)-specific endonuclease VapC
MPFMIDTNIAILARDGDETILSRLAECRGAVVMSALTLVELERGVARDPALTLIRRPRLRALTDTIPVLPFDQDAVAMYGEIIRTLGWVRGRDFDRMIAAHAMSTASVLVTNNQSDFRDIPGLMLENWVTPPP